MAGSCVIVVTCNGVMVSVCPSSTALLILLFTLLFSLLLLQHGSPAGCSPSVESLPWRESSMGHSPSGVSLLPRAHLQPYVLSSLSLPMSPQASPHVFPPVSRVLPQPLSLFHKRAHTQCLLCLQGRHLAGRQLKYDPKSLGASANLSFEFNELWIVPLWNENLAEESMEKL